MRRDHEKLKPQAPRSALLPSTPKCPETAEPDPWWGQRQTSARSQAWNPFPTWERKVLKWQVAFITQPAERGLVWFGFWEREKPRHITPGCGGAGAAPGSPSVTTGEGWRALWPVAWDGRWWGGHHICVYTDKQGELQRAVTAISPFARQLQQLF